MKVFAAILLLLSVVGSVLWLVPIPNETLWPAGMVAHELWPWLMVANALGIAVSVFRRKWTVLIFAVGLTLTVRPLTQIHGVEDDVAGQWTTQRIASATPSVPNTVGLVWQSLSVIGIPGVQPNVLQPDILLYKSPSSIGHEPLPIVIDIHGGSWQHENAATDASFSSYMAAKGYAVFSIDYRKAPQFHYPVQIDDVRAAVDWIYANAFSYGADPTRIALIGRSAGAQLALLDAYTSSVIPIRAVVSFYGPTDLAELYANPPRWDPIDVPGKLASFLGGSPDDAREAYRDASPVNHLKANLPPTLLIQGRRDRIVTSNQARDLHQRLTESGSRSVLVEIPWADHSFDFVYFGPGNLLALAYIERFLNDVLPEGAKPVPE
jgi:acetyl esterase/lipase